jgi:signal transduction histidine kinase
MYNMSMHRFTSIKNFFERLSLVQQFMLISLIILILGMLGLGSWVENEIKSGVIDHAGATTALYLDSFVAPLMQEMATGDAISPATIDRLSSLLSDTPLGQHVVSFKVWDPSGKVIYATDRQEIGKSYPLTQRLLLATNGRVSSKVSYLNDVENADLGKQYASLLETYSPILLTGTTRVIAVAEFYEPIDRLQREIQVARRNSWLVVGASMLVIYILLSGFVRRANLIIETQRGKLNTQVIQLRDLLDQNNRLNERVQRAAASVTTLNEQNLRRIGSELHDGPLQELGLALLKVDTVIANCETPQKELSPNTTFPVLEKIQASLQSAMKEIRTISAGLSVPHLNELRLEEVVNRAVLAHMRRTGTRVDLKLDKLPEKSSMPVKITIYRLLQEALNNAYQHAGGIGQEVTVRKDNGSLLLEVVDHGPGFDTRPDYSATGQLGLPGMRERVESLGGTFELESAIGKGTRIAVRLPIEATWRQA